MVKVLTQTLCPSWSLSSIKVVSNAFLKAAVNFAYSKVMLGSSSKASQIIIALSLASSIVVANDSKVIKN
jgi:hypothetical protein